MNRKILRYKIVECGKCNNWLATKSISHIDCPFCAYRNKITWKTNQGLCKVIRYSFDFKLLLELSREHNLFMKWI